MYNHVYDTKQFQMANIIISLSYVYSIVYIICHRIFLHYYILEITVSMSIHFDTIYIHSMYIYFQDLVQDCGISKANTLKIPQFVLRHRFM